MEVQQKDCCCKKGLCDVSDSEDDSTEIYSPNHDLCCKFKSRSCGHILSWSKFKDDAPDVSFCKEAPHVEFKPPPRPPQVIRSDVKPGHPAHTVKAYCDLSSQEELAEDEESVDDSENGFGSKKALMQSMINEITSNSIDSMAKEIFSIYVCTRWAPNSEFTQILDGEMATGQLPRKKASKLYRDGRFIPLRCSENFKVFSDASLGKTNFEVFEGQMQSLATWYAAEKDGAVSSRLAKLAGVDLHPDLREATAFDLGTVAKAAQGCDDSQSWISVIDAKSQELLSNCRTVKWWLSKLRDWHRAMPFTSFMSPDQEGAKMAPKQKEQVLMCFGKRVASQLHRREGGQHLMTDQNAIGCHGFWNMGQAALMLDRIVKLWRPPTCQLASMELEMKVKIMELIASMNSRLFDALPALLTEEISASPDFDGKALEASSLGVSLVRGMWQTITSSFSALKGQYTRLGQLLGNTVVKWTVCPLKNISEAQELDKLDSALGTEDDLARYYAEIAYAKWTGKTNLLPGEECIDEESLRSSMAHCRVCTLGTLQQDMPEPYKDEKFICPVRPFLPAKQQLEIFEKKNGWCPLRMNSKQMEAAKWFYRGRTPQKTQHDMMENKPQGDFQAIKLVDFKSRQDSDFHMWRSFATVSLQCTREESEETPRWCKDPEVHYSSGSVNSFVDSMGRVGRGARRLVMRGMHKAGMAEEPKTNNAPGKAFTQWLYQRGKHAEAWLKGTSSEWFGKAADRYEKLRTKSFHTSEAAELLHSMSFQRELESTGADSKQKQRYERFAVIAPCKSMDPETEFDLKYESAEDALQLARKVHQKFDASIFKSKAFAVQLMGASILKMNGDQSAWVEFRTLVRAFSPNCFGKECSNDWVVTKNAMIGELAGSISAHGGESVRSSDLTGFEATFNCGTRPEMHDLPRERLGKAEPPVVSQSFVECVTHGAVKNKELRNTAPEAPYLREETVVRITFHSLEDCRLHLSTARNSNETENPVYRTFSSISGCPGIAEADFPKILKRDIEESRFRGLLLGSGLPDETLFEVLVDPEDFLKEVPL